MEHKLGMMLYGDQVLEISTAAAGCLLLLEPEEFLTAPGLAWGPDALNDAERTALQAYIEGYKRTRSDKEAEEQS